MPSVATVLTNLLFRSNYLIKIAIKTKELLYLNPLMVSEHVDNITVHNPIQVGISYLIPSRQPRRTRTVSIIAISNFFVS